MKCELRKYSCTGSVACGILANPQRFGKKKIGFVSTYNQPLSTYLKAVSQLTGKEAELDSTAATTSNLGQVRSSHWATWGARVLLLTWSAALFCLTSQM